MGDTKQPLIQRVRSTLAPRTRLKRLRELAPIGRRNGTLFIGYAEGDLGLGQGFRNDLKSAELASLPFAVYPLRVGIETRLIGPFMPERYDLTHAYPVNIIEVAPDQLPVALRAIDRRLTRNSYNILRTFWELPEAPRAWRPILRDMQEIWAPNSFVAEALRYAFAGPIAVVPHTVDVGTGPYPTRDQLGMELDRFYFFFNFDYYSSPYRKNPLGAVQAFQSAFQRGDENVGLIIKSIGAADRFPEIKKSIEDAAAADNRIVVIDRSLSRRDLLGMICATDAYLSFHRSEGFGSGMAEAMSFGRIVIGTNFSGNTDFLTEETGFPIPYALRPIAPYEYPWSEGQNWAEPDVKAAVAAMKLVVQKPDTVRDRAAAGQRLIRQNYAPAVVGQIFKRRLRPLMTL